jgi:hypothetical protein
MTRHIPIPAARHKTLAEERADFTAEGAPPPGIAGASSAAVRLAAHDVADDAVSRVSASGRPILHLPQARRRVAGATA